MSASVWRKCNLKQFATIYSGTDYKHNKKGEDFPIIGTGGIMGYTGEFLNEGPAVLTGRKGTIDRPIYIEGKFWNVDTIFCIKPFDSTNVKYFYYSLSNKNLLLLNEATGVPGVSSDNLYKQSFIFPKNIEVQKHIADILSTCDTVIQKTQKTIDKYKAIKQGMMQDLFTRGLTKDGKLRPSYKEAPELYKESELGMIPKEWEVNTTEFLAQRLWIGLVTTMTSHYVDEGIPLIRNSDISENKIEDVEIFLDYDFAKANASREVHLGDVVTVHTGDIGTSSVINEKYDGAHGFATINTTVNKTIINEDYCRYMNSFEFKKQALRAITGDGRQNLNIYDFINLLIPYPNDIKEQTLIVDRLKSIDSTIQKEESILEKYKNIKTGLMARLLTPPEDAEIIDETGDAQ